MADVSYRTLQNRIKAATDNFTFSDLDSFVREKANPNSPVTVLKKGRWVKVNNHQLLVTEIKADYDDAWIEIVICEDKPLWNWLLLPLARLQANKKQKQVVWWQPIPDTGLLLDVWYAGDGSGGIPLVVEVKQ